MFLQRFQTRTYASPQTPTPTPPLPNPQTQSLLLTRLPPELKNKIYTLVFTAPSLAPHPNHPLALLLTCRQIHSTASLLAFTTHTFALGPSLPPTYLALHRAIAHLPGPHAAAIRALSASSSTDTCALLSNALLLLPSLSNFTITTAPPHSLRCGPCVRPADRALPPPHVVGGGAQTQLERAAVSRYAAPWLVDVVAAFTSGRAVKWQTGQRWGAQWPQLDSEACYSVISRDGGGAVLEELVMEGQADGDAAMAGVETCEGGCGGVVWVRAVLVQEGGRQVVVEAVGRRGGTQVRERPRKYVPGVMLVEGARPAEGVDRVREEGIGFDADEAYWEATRRRNGNLGAVCRGLWKSADKWLNAAVVSVDDGVMQSPLESCKHGKDAVRRN